MIVLVDEVVMTGDSVILVTGTADDGSEVTFGMDHRMAAGLAEHVEYHGETACEVEGWQIMRRQPVTTQAP